MSEWIALLGVLLGSVITLSASWLTNRAEHQRQIRKEAQELYVNCIQSLSLILTLARIDSDANRMNDIEVALAEAKAYLSLILSQYKDHAKLDNKQKQIRKEIELFSLGRYQEVLEEAKLKPQDRFLGKSEDFAYLAASDILFQRLIELIRTDKRIR